MSRIVDKPFTDTYNECNELYDKGELEKCIEKAQEILEDGATPRYHRMKPWILLEDCLGVWDEAIDCYNKAQSVWQIVRRWSRAGDDAEADAALEELYSELEALKKTLAEDQAAYDPDEEVGITA